jgi:hypothetical protein
VSVAGTANPLFDRRSILNADIRYEIRARSGRVFNVRMAGIAGGGDATNQQAISPNLVVIQHWGRRAEVARADELMALATGARLGPYEVIRPEFASDPERLARLLIGCHIQTYAMVYTDGGQVAKAITTTRVATGGRPRRSSRRSGWVRKNVAVDQRKLDVARRALGVDTETEAIDQALDFVAFGEELAKGFAAVRRSGGVDDVLERRRRA